MHLDDDSLRAGKLQDSVQLPLGPGRFLYPAKWLAAHLAFEASETDTVRSRELRLVRNDKIRME
jgi:hypothetical protein